MNEQATLTMAPNQLIPASDLRRWFRQAFRDTSSAPSLAQCDELARKIQIAVNRCNNSELQRHGPVPLTQLKDVSPADEMERRVGKLMSVANQLLVDANELEDYAGGHQWWHAGDVVSLQDLQKFLNRIGARPVTQVSSPLPARGRPREIWHSAAREIASLISTLMRDAGYRGRVRMNDEESVAAIVGAAGINWAYGINIQPSGFASAMRQRDRRKKRNATIAARSRNKRVQKTAGP